ncbi:hypothetical protein BU16DRAFT_528101 [Lophium mytilinum]|uniref:Uncharacterized protein n=1 Tax=Lophium mytilinum TaxID=390894 RepID=A0A6A6QPI4_9PEZI|nr:hypothetical protein BU16DRAFT_528101 [Lophium mytilinum]
MPRYRCVNANVQLCATSLVASTTPRPTTRKGPESNRFADNAEKVLREGRILAETKVGVPLDNGEDGGLVHFLGKYGNMPFLMVHAGAGLFKDGLSQEIHATRASERRSSNGVKMVSASPASRDGDSKGEKAKDGLQDDVDPVSITTRSKPSINSVPTASSDADLAPQALCLQVYLSPDTFLLDPMASAKETNRDIKIDVFFNGVFANSGFIPGRDRYIYNRGTSALFSGERFHLLMERPWIIVPPGQEADGSLRGTIKKSKALSCITAEERWNQIGAALLAEADILGYDKRGDRPPSGNFLESLANMKMPGAVDAMQKPAGPKFGVIDVIISVGQGNKHSHTAPYIKEPTRPKDDNFKPLSEVRETEIKAKQNVVNETVLDPIQSVPQPDLTLEEAQRTQILPSNPIVQPPGPHPDEKASPPSFLRGFLPSSSFSDYNPSPDDGRHKRGQMRMGTSGNKGTVISQSAGGPESARAPSDRRSSLPNPPLNMSLRSGRNSLEPIGSSTNLMLPPLAPASSFASSSPNKRRRSSLPTPDGGRNKRQRVSERINIARPTVEPLTPLPDPATPPSSLGISRRGVFTGVGSPTAIPELTLPSTAGSDQKDGNIVIENDPFEPRIQLPSSFTNRFSTPSGLPLGLSGMPLTKLGAHTFAPRTSVVVHRVVIKAGQRTVVDKFLTTGYRLPLHMPNSSPPKPPPPPRRSTRIQRSETPGSGAYMEPSGNRSRAPRGSNNDPGTPPPSSSPLKNAKGRYSKPRKPVTGVVPTPTHLLAQIRARQNSDIPPTESAKMDQVVRNVAQQTSQNGWGLAGAAPQSSGFSRYQTPQGYGSTPQQTGQNILGMMAPYAQSSGGPALEVHPGRGATPQQMHSHAWGSTGPHGRNSSDLPQQIYQGLRTSRQGLGAPSHPRSGASSHQGRGASLQQFGSSGADSVDTSDQLMTEDSARQWLESEKPSRRDSALEAAGVENLLKLAAQSKTQRALTPNTSASGNRSQLPRQLDGSSEEPMLGDLPAGQNPLPRVPMRDGAAKVDPLKQSLGLEEQRGSTQYFGPPWQLDGSSEDLQRFPELSNLEVPGVSAVEIAAARDLRKRDAEAKMHRDTIEGNGMQAFVQPSGFQRRLDGPDDGDFFQQLNQAAGLPLQESGQQWGTLIPRLPPPFDPRFEQESNQAMRTSLQQPNQGGSGFLQQSGLSVDMRVMQPANQTLQQPNQRQKISPRQVSGSTRVTPQPNVPSLEHGNVQTEARAGGMRRMRNSHAQDTIQVKPRISSAPDPMVDGPTLLPSPVIKTPSSVPSRLIQKARESLGSDDSPLSSGPSDVSTPRDMQFTPTRQLNGRENQKESVSTGANLPKLQIQPHSPLSSAPSNPTTPQDMGFEIAAPVTGTEEEVENENTENFRPLTPQAQASTPGNSVQSITDHAPFDPALLSEDCVITYAKKGPWTVPPTAGEAVRQVRGAKGGVFREEEVVFGVRFLLG